MGVHFFAERYFDDEFSGRDICDPGLWDSFDDDWRHGINVLVLRAAKLWRELAGCADE